MNKHYEIRVGVPEGHRVVGCRTEEGMAIVVFEHVGPEVRQIGFVRGYEDDSLEDAECEDCVQGSV